MLLSPATLNPIEYSMADFQFNCSSCNQVLTVDEEAVGIAVSCPMCSNEISVPQLSSAATEPIPPTLEPTPSPEQSDSGTFSSVKEYLNENQDPVLVKQVLDETNQILTSGENVIYIAVQKKPIANFSPDSVVLTNKRFIIWKPKLFGMKKSFSDYIWRDLQDVHLKEDIMGSTLTMRTINDLQFSVNYLPKQQARKLYSMAQEMEMKVREERRVRELEDKRASSGGVFMQSAPQQPSQEVESSDPMKSLATLKEMFEGGLITEGEFNSKKAEILSRM